MDYTKGKWKFSRSLMRDYIADPHNNIICELYTLGSGDEKHDEENLKANAQLIAAAPDLYEACKEVRIHLRGNTLPWFERRNAYKKVEQALAKVEGK